MCFCTSVTLLAAPENLGRAEARPSGEKLRLRMAGEMDFHAFRQQTLATALAAPGESGAAGFGAQPPAKNELLFPGALRALQGAFYDRAFLRGANLRGHVVLPNSAVNSNPVEESREVSV